MEKLDKNLVARIRKLVRNDSRIDVIDVDTHSEYWLAIIVEDEYTQSLLESVLKDVVDGHYEALVKTGNYEAYSQENPNDLDPCAHDWQVVYVMSHDYWKKRKLYRQ